MGWRGAGGGWEGRVWGGQSRMGWACGAGMGGVGVEGQAWVQQQQGGVGVRGEQGWVSGDFSLEAKAIPTPGMYKAYNCAKVQL